MAAIPTMLSGHHCSPKISSLAPRRVRLVPVHVPMQITCRGFMYRCRRTREIRRHVVFEPAFANKAQQLLQPGNAHDTRPTESLERVIRKLALADVAAHLSLAIVGGKARETHRPALHAAHASPKGILLAHGSGNDFLKIHAHIFEKVLWQVAAVKAHCFVRIIAVQGTTPKNSSSEVQHWIALMVTSVSFIQLWITAPSLAIFTNAASGMLFVNT